MTQPDHTPVDDLPPEKIILKFRLSPVKTPPPQSPRNRDIDMEGFNAITPKGLERIRSIAAPVEEPRWTLENIQEHEPKTESHLQLQDAMTQLRVGTAQGPHPFADTDKRTGSLEDDSSYTSDISEIELAVAEALQCLKSPFSTYRQSSVLVGLCYDPIMERHCGRKDAWERPSRTAVLMEVLEEQGLAQRCYRIPSQPAEDSELRLGHTQEHIDMVETMYTGQSEYEAFGDNYFSAGTADAARMATGCCIQAVQAVLEGKVQAAMAVVRPPGHHAECARAMGFCFYNNVAIAALAARQLGASRVLVLDWDAHHGNGIQALLEGDEHVLYISLHRGPPFYPGTGTAAEVGSGTGEGFTVNVPWPRGGFGDADYLAAFELIVEPITASFEPDLVIVAAGYDAAEGDPLGTQKVSRGCFAHLTDRLLKFAKGKFVACLEGGYNETLTADCAAMTVRAMLRERPPPLRSRSARRPHRETASTLSAVAAVQARYWPILRPLTTCDGFASTWAAFMLTLQQQERALKALGKHWSLKADGLHEENRCGEAAEPTSSSGGGIGDGSAPEGVPQRRAPSRRVAARVQREHAGAPAEQSTTSSGPQPQGRQGRQAASRGHQGASSAGRAASEPCVEHPASVNPAEDGGRQEEWAARQQATGLGAERAQGLRVGEPTNKDRSWDSAVRRRLRTVAAEPAMGRSASLERLAATVPSGSSSGGGGVAATGPSHSMHSEGGSLLSQSSTETVEAARGPAGATGLWEPQPPAPADHAGPVAGTAKHKQAAAAASTADGPATHLQEHAMSQQRGTHRPKFQDVTGRDGGLNGSTAAAGKENGAGAAPSREFSQYLAGFVRRMSLEDQL